MITKHQIAAARALLEWTQDDLAHASGVSKDMISKIEGGKSAGSLKSIQAIESALTIAGIEFGKSDGVKRKDLNTKTYRGQSGFIEFMNLVYETARDKGGEFCVSNVDETIFTQHLGQNEDAEYTEQMKNIKSNYSFKIIIKEGDTNFIGSDYAEYRWIAKDQFHSVPFYVFGDNLAFLIFGEQTTIHLINNAEIASAQRTQFDMAWEGAKITNA